jgi:hypothetical protein
LQLAPQGLLLLPHSVQRGPAIREGLFRFGVLPLQPLSALLLGVRLLDERGNALLGRTVVPSQFREAGFQSAQGGLGRLAAG